MTQFLDGIGYNGWILPALLALPLLGALLMFAQGMLQKGDAESAMRSSRSLALWIFIAEAVLSIGLWWSVDVASPEWQATVNAAWIPQWGARFAPWVPSSKRSTSRIPAFRCRNRSTSPTT